MLLDPAECGEPTWHIARERIWKSPVVINSSVDPRNAPASVTAARQLAGGVNTLWTHIIPLPSQAQAEGLAATLLDRIRPNPNSAITVIERHDLSEIRLRGVSSVRAVETKTVGLDMSGREFILVGVVDNVAFGLGYGCLGPGWLQDRFVAVAQLQADKINRQVGS
jgi:hypothetical protein